MKVVSQADVDAQILALNAQIAGWNAALLADLADPAGAQPDYSLDGETVSREAWREGLMRLIRQAMEAVTLAQQTRNALSPYWLGTRQVLR